MIKRLSYTFLAAASIAFFLATLKPMIQNPITAYGDAGTSTATATATNTQTNTQTATATATATNTQTATVTATASATRTATKTSTATNTATSTRTKIFTQTFTATRTATYTRTNTSTATATRTLTATNTFSSTATKTTTFTFTYTATSTAVPFSPTVTPVRSPTMTFSNGAKTVRVSRLISDEDGIIHQLSRVSMEGYYGTGVTVIAGVSGSKIRVVNGFISPNADCDIQFQQTDGNSNRGIPTLHLGRGFNPLIPANEIYLVECDWDQSFLMNLTSAVKVSVVFWYYTY